MRKRNEIGWNDLAIVHWGKKIKRKEENQTSKHAKNDLIKATKKDHRGKNKERRKISKRTPLIVDVKIIEMGENNSRGREKIWLRIEN
jgi:hypothetical protein